MKYSLRILKNKNIFKKHNYSPPNAFIEHQIFLDHQLKPFFFVGAGGEKVCVSLICPTRNFKKRYAQKMFGCGTVWGILDAKKFIILNTSLGDNIQIYNEESN